MLCLMVGNFFILVSHSLDFQSFRSSSAFSAALFISSVMLSIMLLLICSTIFPTSYSFESKNLAASPSAHSSTPAMNSLLACSLMYCFFYRFYVLVLFGYDSEVLTIGGFVGISAIRWHSCRFCRILLLSLRRIISGTLRSDDFSISFVV